MCFFSKSYKSVIEDWSPYVKFKKPGDDQSYKNLYLYTVVVPKKIYDVAENYMNDKFKEDSVGHPGFWAWGVQTAFTKDLLEHVKIIKVEKIDENEYFKRHKDLKNTYINKISIYPNFDLSSLRKKPKNWLNDFHIKLVSEIEKTKNEDLIKLNNELIRLRLNLNQNGRVTEKDINDVSKKDVEKIINSYEKIISKNDIPKRNKEDEKIETMKKWISHYASIELSPIGKHLLQNLKTHLDDNDYDMFLNTLKFLKIFDKQK